MTNKEYILSTLKSKRADLSAIGIREVGLFGSYARNEQTEQSDIDILVDFDPEKETFDNYMAGMRDRLIHDYMGINYSIVWDVVKNKIPELYPQILEIIDKN
jgi:predicted nucleotidyltransferase